MREERKEEKAFCPEIGREMPSEQQSQQQELEEDDDEEEEKIVLRFLDSTDSYLTLLESLSSSLRQGWLELASARHSMGTSRVNAALLDLTSHSASTWLKVTAPDHQAEQPHFALRKWGSLENDHCYNEEHVSKESMLPEKSGNSVLRHRANFVPSEERDSVDGDTLKVDDQVQKERAKSLSVFGTLVSPKLRAAQLSFETALEMLVEIANMRSAILSTYDQIHK